MAKQKIFVAQEGALYQGGSGSDTIQNFTGRFSSNTVKGGAGNDLITFAHESTAIVLSGESLLSAGGASVISSAGQANSTLTALYNGPVISAGAVDSQSVQVFAISAGGTAGNVTFNSLRNTALATAEASFIQGGAGNDTVQFGDLLASTSGVTVEGGAGNDLIGSYNSGASTAGKFNTVFAGNNFRGAKGNDVLSVDVSALSASDFKLNGNSGNDTVIFSAQAGIALSGKSGAIYGGKGNDEITVINSAGSMADMTIAGGQGNDSVIVRQQSNTFVSGLIALDASNANTGKDTLAVDFGTWSGSTVNGYAGVDSIVLSALDEDGGGNLIAAGRGNDLIEFATAVFEVSASTIQGGIGNDVINNSGSVQAANTQVFASSVIRMGAGDDTLALSASVQTAGVAGLTVVGGQGADSLTVQSIGTAGSGTFAFESYSDSLLGSGDTILIQTADVTNQGATQNAANVNFTIPDTVSLASGSTTAVGNGVSGVSGVINFSGLNENLTSRVNALDASFATTGTVAFFTVQNNDEYFFVQGGATDLVVKLNDSNVLSAGAADGVLKLQYSGKAFGFS
jgi:hypothetical protein